MNRSANNAATIAKALSQPKIRSDGKPDKHGHGKSAGENRRRQNQWRADKNRRPLNADRGIGIDIFDLQAVQEVDGRAQSEPEGHGQCDDAGELQSLTGQQQDSAGENNRK